MKISRAPLLILLILLLAFALRTFALDVFSLRGDEAFTVLFVQKPLAQMWHEILTVEPNPPLLYFALRAWIGLAGDGEFATRYFAAFFGMLCVALVYRAAREIFDRAFWNRASARIYANKNTVALIAAFILAINPYQIWHSQDVRNYTLWPALSLLALIFFWQWYRRGAPSWSPPAPGKPTIPGKHETLPLLFFVLAELAALYAHYYEAFILLALNVFVLATLWRDLKKLAQWLAAQIVLAVLYLPYPLVLSNRVSAYGEGSGRQGVALWDVARETFAAFVVSDTWEAEWRAWLWIPFALLALVGLILLLRREWRRGLFFALYIGVPTLAVFALNTVRPLYLERYLNGIAPAYYLLLAFSIVALGEGLPRAFARFASPAVRRAQGALVQFTALVALVILAFFALQNYWMNPAFAKAPDWRGLTRIINANAQPGDLIVQNFPEMSLLYYDRSKLPLVVYPETFLPDAKTAQQLNAVNATYKRVWFIPAAPDFWDPEQYVEQWLDRRGDLLQTWNTRPMRLSLYAMASGYLNAMTKSGAVFGDTLRLLGYRAEMENSAPKLVLYWRVVSAPARDLLLRVRYDDAQGNAVQELLAPHAPEYPTGVWRKNESVVSRLELLSEAKNASELRVSVCDGNGENCLELRAPDNARDKNELLIPLR